MSYLGQRGPEETSSTGSRSQEQIQSLDPTQSQNTGGSGLSQRPDPESVISTRTGPTPSQGLLQEEIQTRIYRNRSKPAT